MLKMLAELIESFNDMLWVTKMQVLLYLGVGVLIIYYLIVSIKQDEARYKFEAGCLNFLDAAAYSPTIAIAKQRLEDAMVRCETVGISDIQQENLAALRVTLSRVPPTASAKEQYYALRQLQEVLEGSFQ